MILIPIPEVNFFFKNPSLISIVFLQQWFKKKSNAGFLPRPWLNPLRLPQLWTRSSALLSRQSRRSLARTVGFSAITSRNATTYTAIPLDTNFSVSLPHENHQILALTWITPLQTLIHSQPPPLMKKFSKPSSNVKNSWLGFLKGARPNLFWPNQIPQKPLWIWQPLALHFLLMDRPSPVQAMLFQPNSKTAILLFYIFLVMIFPQNLVLGF